MPPGFGYSQNTSVADGNSIGVMNDEETASNLSEEGAALLPAEKASGKSAAPSNPSKRSLKLKNKVYFQLLELTNALQQSQEGGWRSDQAKLFHGNEAGSNRSGDKAG